MSNSNSNSNSSTKKNNKNKNGKRNNQSQKKSKRSAAAIERRRAKWQTQKAEKKGASIAEQQAKREAREAEETRKQASVLEMFPNVMGIVGAQGHMQNIQKVKLLSKGMANTLKTVPLFQNADMATIYSNGRTIFGKYIEDHDWDKVLELLIKGIPKRIMEHPTSTGIPPIVYVFNYSNRPDIFKKMLDKGVDANMIVPTNRVGIPLLGYVVGGNQSDAYIISCIDELLRHKANINKVDAQGFTALDYTIRWKKNTIAKYLIEKGAAIEVPNEAGFTALLTSITYNNEEMFKYIAGKGIDINKKTGTKKIQFPLKSATLHGKKELLGLVLDLSPELNTKDEVGNTALHYAVLTKAYEKIQMLKDAGATININNQQMVTPFDLAKALERDGKPRAYEILRQQ